MDKKRKGDWIMLYCSKCKYLTDEKKCPHCGNKHLRAVEGDDAVFLMDTDAFTAPTIEDILAQNEIPCQLQGLIGAGMIVLGSGFEMFRVFVPYSDNDRAKDLLANFLETEELPDDFESESLPDEIP
jgi:RNA polymerase subunit RPABC4/transcription elongation factor Spt4